MTLTGTILIGLIRQTKGSPFGQLWGSTLDFRFTSLHTQNTTRIKLVTRRLQESLPNDTVVSSDIVANFEWQTLNENLGSDHLIITLWLNLIFNMNKMEILNFKRANLCKYDTDLEEYFSIFALDNSNVKKLYYRFAILLHLSHNKNVPKISICSI